MPDSRIVTLAAGPGWIPARPVEDDAPPQFRWSTGYIVARPARGRAPTAHVLSLASYVAMACDSGPELALAGTSLNRLVTITLSRKLGPMGESNIGAGERRRLLRAAGVPGALYANPATEAIFSSSAEALGKGGVLGSISNAVSHAAQQIGKVAEVAFPIPYIATKLAMSVVNKGPQIVNGLVSAGEGLISKVAQNPAAIAGPLLAGIAGGALPGIGEVMGGGSGGYSDPYANTPDTATNYSSSAASYTPFLIGGGVLLGLYLLMSGGRRRR